MGPNLNTVIAWCQSWFIWEKREIEEDNQELADLNERVSKLENRIMAVDAKLQAFFDQVTAFIGTVSTYETNVQASLGTLNSKVADLQAQLAAIVPGLSADDQAGLSTAMDALTAAQAQANTDAAAVSTPPAPPATT